MNVGTVSHITYAACPGAGGTAKRAAAFGQLLAAAQRQGAQAAPTRSAAGGIQVFLPNEDTVCSCGRGEQYVYAQYTADSTAEDPIVKIYCRSNSGTYEFTRHIRDIDPRNASYAELAALYGHQAKAGGREIGGLGAVPLGYEVGNFMHKQDFISGLREFSASERSSQNIVRDAKELLALYRGLLEDNRRSAAETAAFGALMDALDNVRSRPR